MEVKKVCNSIIKEIQIDNPQMYEDYLLKVYGALFLNNIDENVVSQIINFEKIRLSKKGDYSIKQIKNYHDLARECSAIAFEMAKLTFLENIECKELAQELLKGFVRLAKPEHLTKFDYKLISETILDFEYASGNHNISSIRMSPIIRSNHLKAKEV